MTHYMSAGERALAAGLAASGAARKEDYVQESAKEMLDHANYLAGTLSEAGERERKALCFVLDTREELLAALRKSDAALSKARGMLIVFEDPGGHDYVATIDHIDEARTANCAAIAHAEGR